MLTGLGEEVWRGCWADADPAVGPQSDAAAGCGQLGQDGLGAHRMASASPSRASYRQNILPWGYLIRHTATSGGIPRVFGFSIRHIRAGLWRFGFRKNSGFLRVVAVWRIESPQRGIFCGVGARCVCVGRIEGSEVTPPGVLELRAPVALWGVPLVQPDGAGSDGVGSQQTRQPDDGQRFFNLSECSPGPVLQLQQLGHDVGGRQMGWVLPLMEEGPDVLQRHDAKRLWVAGRLGEQGGGGVLQPFWPVTSQEPRR